MKQILQALKPLTLIWSAIRSSGNDVARLIPSVKEEQDVDLKQVRSSFREIRERISGKVSIRHLIEEGRRF
jgi:hypothetical protein